VGEQLYVRKLCSGKLKERGYFEDLDREGEIILNRS
jgi:hypothetical protein